MRCVSRAARGPGPALALPSGLTPGPGPGPRGCPAGLASSQLKPGAQAGVPAP